MSKTLQLAIPSRSYYISLTTEISKDQGRKHMKVLVLGGTGFIGRHAILALLAAARACETRSTRLERLTARGSWDGLLEGIDVVVNCVGILRERGEESYERIHHLAPAALVEDCARLRVRRLIHVSALGLQAGARSAFLTSKLRGEKAVKSGRIDWTIVRPSLLDGEGGFGARWMRMVARWPRSEEHTSELQS